MSKSNSDDFAAVMERQSQDHIVLTEARAAWLAQGKLQLLVPVNAIMGLVRLFGVCLLAQLQ